MNSTIKPTIVFTFSMEISEPEARTLARIASYNVDEVCKALGNHLSKDFLNHDALITFIKNIRETIEPQVEIVDKARKAISEALSKA